MSKRVLIVDDSSFMRTMVKTILTEANCTVCGEAGNGNEGFSQFKQLKPDLVTLDITMPECDGLECLKKIMEYDSNANVIMCSAMGQQAMVLDAIQSGAKDFLVKPFQKDRVFDTVYKILP